MPPRYAYWTILAGGLPTSFRSAEREDLLPTLRRLQTRHPDAELKWFARGKLWTSPEAARDYRPARVSRGPGWRPGGEHRDPRAKYEAAKKARNQARRTTRFERKQSASPARPTEDGQGSRARGPAAQRPQKTSRAGGPTRPQVRPPAKGRRGR